MWVTIWKRNMKQGKGGGWWNKLSIFGLCWEKVCL
jgi:hypothetical protein